MTGYHLVLNVMFIFINVIVRLVHGKYDQNAALFDWNMPLSVVTDDVMKEHFRGGDTSKSM